jgi:hypothetical protein
MELRQFKLTNNEEIICDVIEWDDEENNQIVVKKALRIIGTDDFDEDGNYQALKYYTYKPWVLMNTDPDALVLINADHIVAETIPCKVAVEYYVDVIKDLVAEEVSDTLDAIDQQIKDAFEDYDQDESDSLDDDHKAILH